MRQDDHANGFSFTQKRDAKRGAKSGLLRKFAHGVLGITHDIAHMNGFSVEHYSPSDASSRALVARTSDKFV